MEQPIPSRGRVPRDSFALRLLVMRHELDLSQEEAADRCGLKPSTWATWENGVRPRGMDVVVSRIADALGYDRGWLMFGGHVADEFDGPDDAGGLPLSGRACNAEVLEFRPRVVEPLAVAA